MEIKKFILLSISMVMILGIVESFDYHEKELESEEGLKRMYDRWRTHHKVEQKNDDRFNVFKYNVRHVLKHDEQTIYVEGEQICWHD